MSLQSDEGPIGLLVISFFTNVGISRSSRLVLYGLGIR